MDEPLIQWEKLLILMQQCCGLNILSVSTTINIYYYLLYPIWNLVLFKINVASLLKLGCKILLHNDWFFNFKIHQVFLTHPVISNSLPGKKQQETDMYSAKVRSNYCICPNLITLSPNLAHNVSFTFPASGKGHIDRV